MKLDNDLPKIQRAVMYEETSQGDGFICRSTKSRCCHVPEQGQVSHLNFLGWERYVLGHSSKQCLQQVLKKRIIKGRGKWKTAQNAVWIYLTGTRPDQHRLFFPLNLNTWVMQICLVCLDIDSAFDEVPQSH